MAPVSPTQRQGNLRTACRAPGPSGAGSPTGSGCSTTLLREAAPAAFHCKHRRAQHLLSDNHSVSDTERHLAVAIQRELLFAGVHTRSSRVPAGPGQHQPVGHVPNAPRGGCGARHVSRLSRLTPRFPAGGVLQELPSLLTLGR